MSGFKFTTANMLQILDQDLRGTWAKEKAFLEQKIEFLNESIAEYARREDDNKKINSMLIDLLSSKEADTIKDKQTQLAIINSQLKEELNSTKRIHQQIVDHYQNQIKILKDEILQKQRERVARDAKYQLQITELQTKLNLQKKIEQLSQQHTQRKELITTTNMREIMFSALEMTRREPHRTQQLKNVSSIQSRVNSISDVFKSSTDLDIQNNINQGNQVKDTEVRKQRVKSYMKKDKKQIKMMMSTLLKTKQQLREGEQNMTYMMERQSVGRIGNKGSKSFYH